MKNSKIKFVTLSLSALLFLGQPLAIALADNAPATTSQAAIVDPAVTPAASDPAATATPDPPAQGPSSPTGPSEPTGPGKPTGVVPDYAYNDPTSTWLPTDQSSFYWDAGIGRYNSPLYWFDSQSGWYHVNQNPHQPVAALGSTAESGNNPASQAAALPSAGGSPNSAAATLAKLLGLSDPSNSNTGAGSLNSASNLASTTTMLQLLSQALLNNNTDSSALSGNASVNGNTSAGDATTGPATVINNLINLLSSAWSWSNGALSTFVSNLFGNHTGDITLQPTSSTAGGGGLLGSLAPDTGVLLNNSQTGPNSTNTASNTGNNNVTVVNKPTGSIVNNIDALAQSGNAGVTGNTLAGNATSGDALVDLNILNLINSAISSGDSFFGLLNIFGNLNGDILFPDGFLDSALASSTGSAVGPVNANSSQTGPNSINTANSNQANSANILNSPEANFLNNINTNAASGNANVANNTAAGNASTGTTATNDNLFNLFNTSLFGDNAVLVLVNVMGHWVGHIMTLPTATGSTGALLGGGATLQNNQTGPGSTNTATNNQTNNLNLTNQPSGSIVNNVRAGAISGDASVTDNTSAGNATSGSAKVATNIANIFGSQLNLKHWFGVLVINVFGDWNGSVGDNTAAGDPLNLTAMNLIGGMGASGSASSTTAGNTTPTSVLPGSAGGSGDTSALAAAPASNADPTTGQGSQIAGIGPDSNPISAAKTSADATSKLFLLAALAMGLAGGMMAYEKQLRARAGH